MTAQTQDSIPALSLKWRLQMALDESGVSVEDMAERLDVSRSTISRWINGRGAEPKRPFLIEWANITGVPLAWIEHGLVPVPTPPNGPKGKRDDAKLAELNQKKMRRTGGTSDTQQYFEELRPAS